uniref:Nrg-1 n=1 Tax=Hofstenia miamia TaxID=442651 RepID=A0A8K1R708_HOFMI|nr:nrg-1 [Hofstenia miamia]
MSTTTLSSESGSLPPELNPSDIPEGEYHLNGDCDPSFKHYCFANRGKCVNVTFSTGSYPGCSCFKGYTGIRCETPGYYNFVIGGQVLNMNYSVLLLIACIIIFAFAICIILLSIKLRRQTKKIEKLTNAKDVTDFDIEKHTHKPTVEKLQNSVSEINVNESQYSGLLGPRKEFLHSRSVETQSLKDLFPMNPSNPSAKTARQSMPVFDTSDDSGCNIEFGTPPINKSRKAVKKMNSLDDSELRKPLVNGTLPSFRC